MYRFDAIPMKIPTFSSGIEKLFVSQHCEPNVQPIGICWQMSVNKISKHDAQNLTSLTSLRSRLSLTLALYHNSALSVWGWIMSCNSVPSNLQIGTQQSTLLQGHFMPLIQLRGNSLSTHHKPWSLPHEIYKKVAEDFRQKSFLLLLSVKNNDYAGQNFQNPCSFSKIHFSQKLFQRVSFLDNSTSEPWKT